MWAKVELVSEDGYDYQFAANVLGMDFYHSMGIFFLMLPPIHPGHYLFTLLLMPALIAGRATAPNGWSRVVSTSSLSALQFTINWDTLEDGPKRRKLSTDNLYCQSKFVSVLHEPSCLSRILMHREQANVVLALEFKRRYALQGIASFSCNPGTRVPHSALPASD